MISTEDATKALKLNGGSLKEALTLLLRGRFPSSIGMLTI